MEVQFYSLEHHINNSTTSSSTATITIAISAAATILTYIV